MRAARPVPTMMSPRVMRAMSVAITACCSGTERLLSRPAETAMTGLLRVAPMAQALMLLTCSSRSAGGCAMPPAIDISSTALTRRGCLAGSSSRPLNWLRTQCSALEICEYAAMPPPTSATPKAIASTTRNGSQ